MKTLSEIRRNLVSFYSTIQDKVTDFSVGSVVSGLFYSFSASLESAYREIEAVKQQAYVATATGTYLDRLIDGTFQLKRRGATRSVGYLVVYGESPVSNFSDIKLRYANYDYESGEFITGVNESTKFIGFNTQGEEGVVYSLIQPRNQAVLDFNQRLITLDRSVQFLILPVASVNKGSDVNVKEGGIYSFPSPPPGLTGVLNTNNPGAVFFSSQQALNGAPFYTRYTEAVGYNQITNSFSVLNAYNFSNEGVIEIPSDILRQKPIVGLYSEFQGGTGLTQEAGLLFEYIDSTSTSITLKLPLENSLNTVPSIKVLDNNVSKTLTLDSFSYDGVTYTNLYDGSFDGIIREFIEDFEDGLLIQQKSVQISPDVIFDPDSVLTPDYTLSEGARLSRAQSEDDDASYRQSLRAYLSSLSRATGTSLEAGALQVPGVAFAKTLSSGATPNGSAVVLVSDENGVLTSDVYFSVKTLLDAEWKAAGINLIIRPPSLLETNVSMNVRLQPGVFEDSTTDQIHSAVADYLSSLEPGDSLRYSDVLEIVSSVDGVLNVFNLVLTKKLTDDTYQTYKAAYDEAVLVQASTSGIVTVERVSPHGVSAGEWLVYVDEDNYSVTNNINTANAIVYATDGPNNFEMLMGDISILDSIYSLLVVDVLEEANSANYFKDVIMSHASVFGTEEDLVFFLSYILGESFVQLPVQNYPLDIENINYQYLRDYESDETEIFRTATITIGNTVYPVIGINYI